MADKYSISLLGVMDRLWFHQIILFSEPPLVLFPRNLEKTLPIQEFETFSPKNNSQTVLIPQGEISSVAAETIPQQVDSEKEEANEKESPPKQRPSRQNLRTRRNRCHSSSPATDKKHSGKRLEKTLSLGELELEEVKGFMDLGFVFDKEHISKQMIRVVPGLQRLDQVMSKDEQNNDEDSEAEEHEDHKEIVRPYLSEAWLIKRPDSPLLNLRIPRISAASDMKKHLRYWAKTVATVVQQES